MHWERVRGKKVEYWSISRNGFTAGCHYGSGHSDNAFHYSVDELLDSQNKNFMSHLPPGVSAKELLRFLLDDYIKCIKTSPGQDAEDASNTLDSEKYLSRIRKYIDSL